MSATGIDHSFFLNEKARMEHQKAEQFKQDEKVRKAIKELSELPDLELSLRLGALLAYARGDGLSVREFSELALSEGRDLWAGLVDHYRSRQV